MLLVVTVAIAAAVAVVEGIVHDASNAWIGGGASTLPCAWKNPGRIVISKSGQVWLDEWHGRERLGGGLFSAFPRSFAEKTSQTMRAKLLSTTSSSLKGCRRCKSGRWGHGRELFIIFDCGLYNPVDNVRTDDRPCPLDGLPRFKGRITCHCVKRHSTSVNPTRKRLLPIITVTVARVS